MRSPEFVVFFVGLAVAAPLGAQSPADRLALVQDTLDSSASVSSTTQFIQQGLQLLQAGKAQGDRDALFEALRDFDQARLREPTWPWPRFGLALAKLALDKDGAISRPVLGGQLTGESYRQGYWRSLNETFARDSMFEPGLRFAVAQAAEQRDRKQPEALARAVVRGARHWPDDTLTQLAAGYVYRTALRYREAAAAFRRYGALGGDTAVALLEEARSLAGDSLLGRAAELYRVGARHLSDSARARYRNDLSWVATGRELNEFDALRRDSVSAWLTRFWQKRDALSARAAGDRLQEHLRRWAYVYRSFRVNAPERYSGYVRVWAPRPGLAGTCRRALPDSLNDVVLRDDQSRLEDERSEEAVLDHRAIIYMRHGEPAWGNAAEPLLADTGVRVSMGSRSGIDSVMANPEADQTRRTAVWVYWIQGRPRAFYFVPGTLVAPGQPPELASALGPLTLSATLPVGLTPFLAELDPVYAHAAHMYLSYNNGLSHATPLPCSPVVQAMTIQSEKDVQTAVRTDSYSLLFPHQFGALMQVYAVGSAYRGDARLLLTAAVPGTRLDSLVARVDGWLQWPLHIRVTAVDTVAGTVARSDTVRTFARRVPFGRDEYFGFTTELPVPAGHYLTHAAVFDSTMTGGSAAEWGNVVVQSSAFSVSDVVLGAEHGGVMWANNGDPFQVNVTGAYRPGEPAPIYYEIYGLTPGRSYHTTISLREWGKRDEGRVAVEFSRTADRPDTHVQLTLDLSKLKPGVHEVTVTIRDEETGAEVRTERVVEIRN
ncbi:MAG TPA: hypothetical protein VFK36_13805 [Gemmatimonadales bacterium]|nr:hypothetical protein [Gemmatimonadales bacterium]